MIDPSSVPTTAVSRIAEAHFAAALGFLALGAAGAAILGPELAAGAYPSPRVVALAHAFTLGWITLSLMGAVYRVLPVMVGEPIRSVRGAWVTFGLYVVGVVPFLGGLVTGHTTWTLAGATLFGSAILLWIVNLGASLARAGRGLSWWTLAGGAVFLLITLILGSSLAGNLRWSFLGANRFTALGVHLHVALGGWVLVVVVGLSRALFRPGPPRESVGETAARAAALLTAAGAGVLSAGHHGPPLVSRWVPALLLAAGLTGFLVQAGSYVERGEGAPLATALRLGSQGPGLLLLSLVLGATTLFAGGPPRIAVAYVSSLLLGFALVLLALRREIVATGLAEGRRGTSTHAAEWASWLLFAGSSALVVSVGVGSGMGVRGAAVVFGGGVALEALRAALRVPTVAGPMEPRRSSGVSKRAPAARRTGRR